MAHAAPTSGHAPLYRGHHGPAGGGAGHARRLRASGSTRPRDWAMPVVLGLVYGYWAAAINRDGGPITGWNILFGFVSAFVFAAAWIGVASAAPRLRREAARAAVDGVRGLRVRLPLQPDRRERAAVRGHVAGGRGGRVRGGFYRYYTHEDAEGNRIR